MARSQNHKTSGAKAHSLPVLIVRAEALTHKAKIAKKPPRGVTTRQGTEQGKDCGTDVQRDDDRAEKRFAQEPPRLICISHKGYSDCVRTSKFEPQRLNSLRKKSETVIPNLGRFCRGEESALFSATADPSRSLTRPFAGVRDHSFSSFSANCKAALNLLAGWSGFEGAPRFCVF